MSDRVTGILAGVVTGVAAYVTGGLSLYASAALGAGVAFAGDIVGFLVKVPSIPESLAPEGGSQVYNQQSASNRARIQQSKPVLFGRFRVFPDLVTQPWSQYVDNQQVVYQLMAVTMGKADLEKLFLGDTEVESFQEVIFQLFQPGETIAPFHTNVASNEEVRDIELQGGDGDARTGREQLNYNGSIIASNEDLFLFGDFSPGMQVRVVGSRLNDGVYTVASIAPDLMSVTVTALLTTELSEHLDGEGAEAFTLSELIAINPATGAFRAHPADTQIEQLAWDIEFPRGLFATDSGGNLASTSVEIAFEYRQRPATAWTLASVQTFSAASLTAQRFTVSHDIDLAEDGHIEARVRRITDVSTSAALTNESRWTGLRGFIRNPNPAIGGASIFPDLTVLAVTMRVSGQIGAGTARRVNGIFQRRLPIYDGSGIEQATSSLVWAFADVVTNTTYGLGKSADVLDIPALQALDAQLAARGDYFNGYFDRSGTAWAALKSIARCGRCTPQTDGRRFWLLRDEPRAVRAALFTDRNIVRDSLSLEFAPRKPESARGLRVSYHDPVTFQVKTVLIGEEASATDLDLFGCTDRAQAWREGNFVLAESQLRRLFVEFRTERDGFVPTFGSLIAVQSFWADAGQSSEVIAVAGDNRTLTLASALDWSALGPFHAQLRDAEGRPTDPLPCARGDDDQTLVLAAPSPIAIYTGADRERTHVALASGEQAPMDVLVRKAPAESEGRALISAVIDVPEVHIDPGPAPPEE